MDESPRGGLGCLGIAGAIAIMVVVMLMLPPKTNNTNSVPGSSITNQRTGTLSGNQVEVMSRNQLNLWSDVQNCYGDYSCVTVVTSTTTSVQNTDVRTTVDGDRNNVYVSPVDGAKFCAGDDGVFQPCE